MANSFHIPYGKQSITQDDIDAVVETLQADFLTQGPKIEEFEKNFAKYVGAKYAVAVSNGTAALHLSLLAHGIKKGDRIITSPITFSASANAALYCGAEVFFADIDPDTYVISISEIEKLLNAHPKGYFKAIIPVDFTGYPSNVERLKELAKIHDLFILEDACHSPGGYFIDSKNEKQLCGNGNYADAIAFSFHPVKHIAAGEGGMITTNDEDLYKKLMMLRTHGITKENMTMDVSNPEEQGSWYYEMQELGYNYRITDIQAALANSQLQKAEEGIDRRQEIAKAYREAFNNDPLKMQQLNEGFFNAHHLFVIEVEDRKGLYDYLRGHNIFSQVHYIPVHLLPYYKKFGWKEGDFPHAEKYYNHCLSLPMYPSMTNEEQEFVIEKTQEFING
ncbi:MAG: UDP-4-amino-4,6-dideoxy-N-acetyl-beta-L-altrosamine transaminase [Flavobacteriales bacterium]|nr:MAG: UDP-4-amino-4,6-dideoxy-N-acetyl-beta-L-altrosamine transaminase [Flavobacteriales bacterium]